jgi:hypothetical protein
LWSWKRFCLPHFTFFLELVEDCNDALFLTRWIEPTTHIQYVAFNFGCKLYMLHATNSTTRIVSMETKWNLCWSVKISESTMFFSCYTFNNSVGEVFSSTWVTKCHSCNLSLVLVRFRSKGNMSQMAIIQSHFGYPKAFGNPSPIVRALLNLILLH